MRRSIAAAVALALLASCGKGGGSTPEAAYNNAKQAVQDKNWRGLYNACDPEAVEVLILGSMMGAGFATMSNKDAKAELDEITKKHGLPENKAPMGGGDMKAAAKEALKDVKDKPGLFADLMAFMEKHMKDQGGMKNEMTGDIKDVKIEGETAKGTVTRADGKSSEIRFVRRNGLWYLSMDR